MAALESRMGRVSADVQAVREDAAAVRHLAAARDRDIADLEVKVDANRSAINALGAQTRERFDAVDRRFEAVDRRFDALERKVDDGFRRMDERFARVDENFARVDDAFRRIDEEFRKVDNGFLEMRAKFDMTAAGMERIANLLEQRGDNR